MNTSKQAQDADSASLPPPDLSQITSTQLFDRNFYLLHCDVATADAREEIPLQKTEQTGDQQMTQESTQEFAQESQPFQPNEAPAPGPKVKRLK